MRLFVAIRLPAHVVHGLDAALADVRRDHADLRWIPAQRWHLTLAFFGEVGDREVAALRARVGRRVSRCEAMELRLRGGGRFGDRVLWVGVDGHTANLRLMAGRMAYDDRPYRPHLTVARARQHADLRPVVQRVAEYAGPAWTATTVELIESRLGPRPEYLTVECWQLRPFTTKH